MADDDLLPDDAPQADDTTSQAVEEQQRAPQSAPVQYSPDSYILKGTHFANPTDWATRNDPHDAQGRMLGAFNNPLQPGDVSISPAAAEQMGLKPFDKLEATTPDGRKFVGRYADKTNDRLDDRFDIYDPAGVYPDATPGMRVRKLAPGEPGTSDSSLLDKIRERAPELKDVKDGVILDKLRARVAPWMDAAKFETIAKSNNGGEEAIRQEAERTLTPIKLLKTKFPKLAGVPDDVLEKKLYDRAVSTGRLDPQIQTFDDFKDKLSPPDPVTSTLHNVAKGFSNQASASLHEGAAKMWRLPQSLNDVDSWLYGSLIGKKNLEALEQMRNNFPVANYFKGIVGWFNQNSQAQTNEAELSTKKAEQAQGVGGYVGRVAGGIVGSTPELMMTAAIPEASIATRITMAAGYEAVSGFGANIQQGAQKAFYAAAKDGVMGATQAMLLNAPLGRLSTGFYNAALSTGEPELEKWMKGEHSTLDDFTLRASVDFGLGALLGHGKEKSAPRTDLAGEVTKTHPVSAGDILGGETQDTGFGGDVLGVTRTLPPSATNSRRAAQAAPEQLTPSQLMQRMSAAGSEVGVTNPEAGLSEYGLPASSTEELSKAFEARENGDYKTAAQHIDMAVAYLSEKDRTQVHERIVEQTKDIASTKSVQDRTVEDVTANKPASIRPPAAGKNAFTDQYFIGNKRRGQSGQALNPAEVVMDLLGGASRVARETVAKVHEGAKEKSSIYGDIARLSMETFNPESKSDIAREAGAEIGSANARIAFDQNVRANELFRQQKIADDFKFGERSERRDNYINKYTKDRQTEMLMLSEEGKPTGDHIYDRMNEVYDIGYEQMAEADEHEGIEYDRRENYLFHVLKDKTQRDNFTRDFAMRYPEPGYTKARAFETYRQALTFRDPKTGKAKYELVTASPERLFQARLYEFSKAREKIHLLDRWKQDGYAFETKQADIPDEVKTWNGGQTVHSPNGKNYYVHPDKMLVLRNAWDPSKLHDSLAGPFIKLSKVFKAVTVPIRLGDSMAHEAHVSVIRLADRWANLLRAASVKDSSVTGGDFLKAIADVPTFGVSQIVRDVRTRGSLTDAMQGKRAMDSLTDGERWQAQQLTDAGFSAGVSHEREMEWSRWLSEQFPKWIKLSPTADKALNMGWQWITLQNVQKYMFGHVIPTVKASSMLEHIDTLYKERPELLDPKNDSQRLVALRGIQQQLDRRFGEMFYDNVFWKKEVKDTGIGMFLSLGWQLGLVDYVGGTVKDLGHNAAHMDKLIDTFKKQGAIPAARKAITDRLLYAGLYTGASMLQGGLLTYLNTGKGPQEWMDYFFPRVGTDSNGQAKRVRTMNFPGEMVAWYEHMKDEGSALGGTGVMVRNKLNPVFSSVGQTLFNVDYFGRHISSNDDPLFNQIADRTGYLLGNMFTPISLPSYLKPAQELATGQPVESLPDAVMAFFGFNSAPHWTERTSTENDVLRIYSEEHGHSTEKPSAEHEQRKQVVSDYQKAIVAKDDAAIRENYQKLHGMGITDKTMKGYAKTAGIPWSHLAFARISKEQQVRMLKKMNESDRSEWLNYASKAAKELYNEGSMH
jgi:hypothetical protein